MAKIPTSEGQIPFQIPGENNISCSTYYKVFGDLARDAPAVVILHGGPGGGHEYLLSFAELWPRYGLPVVLYDQIGCGASTHLPQMEGNKGFWQESLFVAELDNLLDHLKLREGPGFHLLGQSWGGILGVAFAASRPRGLRRLVLASALASMELSVQSIQLCRSELPMNSQRVLDRCEQEADYESQAYKEALTVFHKMFVCRAEPVPAELMLAFQHLSDDRTVYGTMYGPSVFKCTGSLRSWSSIPCLPQITAPTLVYNGEYDTSRDISQEPFFDHIPRVRWITFQGGSHMCHLDAGGLGERVLKVVGEFLMQHKAVALQP
ncbi:proline-specific peptidase [Annulohypoxylon maeteangense]|uniref:proline-specific peptidase n=1 Tax=Annulohypoxylon maeteangense TaxID=1927788 RepID=UPI0020084175|nr:proline-specific peptidase [Annulohypoxylon maeteangense]KAI0886417.1 proline-specific peptidase [Annulohypoxylon maeteangense]